MGGLRYCGKDGGGGRRSSMPHCVDCSLVTSISTQQKEAISLMPEPVGIHVGGRGGGEGFAGGGGEAMNVVRQKAAECGGGCRR